jgi:transcriptional regulator with XRE-family HTH domain
MDAIRKPSPITKREAIEWAGSMSELARRLDVSVSAVSQWAEDGIPELRLWQLAQMGCRPGKAKEAA